MNDRIEKLSEQADDYADDYLGTPGEFHPNWHTVRDNKFAELIIKESIIDFYRRYLDTTSNEDITVQVERYIRDHFGVEE
ncbi:hypothetical protein EB001_14820 [bacterium]|nr:hypothetical protein [bacterium]